MKNVAIKRNAANESCLTFAELIVVPTAVSQFQASFITETYPTFWGVHPTSFGPTSDVFAITTKPGFFATSFHLARKHDNKQQKRCYKQS